MSEIIGNKIIKFECIDSTNNYATIHMHDKTFNEGTVIFADEQLTGRGQKNNSWESEKGKNLLFSFVLFPHYLPVQSQFLISKVVALGISEVISLYAEDVSVKWPNDIYVGDKKIAGILIESSLLGNTMNYCVVGIGINVNQRKFTSNAPNPVSLFQILNIELDRDEIIVLVLNAIDKWYNKLMQKEVYLIDQEYLTSMYKVDTVSLFKDSEGKFTGRIIGVDSLGQLVMVKENGEVKVYGFKEVEFLPNNNHSI